MKRGQTFGLEEFLRLAFSVVIAVILLAVLVNIYLWWSAPALKEEATAENVLDNFVNVINAQEGEWSAKTFVYLPGDYFLVGFSNKASEYAEIKKPCLESCICVLKLVDNNAEATSCKDVKYASLSGEEYVPKKEGVGGSYSTGSNFKIDGFNRNKGVISDDGFFISKDSGCNTYELRNTETLSVLPSC